MASVPIRCWATLLARRPLPVHLSRWGANLPAAIFLVQLGHITGSNAIGCMMLPKTSTIWPLGTVAMVVAVVVVTTVWIPLTPIPSTLAVAVSNVGMLLGWLPFSSSNNTSCIFPLGFFLSVGLLVVSIPVVVGAIASSMLLLLFITTGDDKSVLDLVLLVMQEPPPDDLVRLATGGSSVSSCSEGDWRFLLDLDLVCLMSVKSSTPVLTALWTSKATSLITSVMKNREEG